MLAWFLKDAHSQAPGHIDPVALAVSIFAAIFLVVGVARIVEFEGCNLGRLRRLSLIGAHGVGCSFFALALVLAAGHFHADVTKWAMGLFVASLVFLCPGQVTLAMHRRRTHSCQS